MNYYTRQQNRRRSEATEQETLIAWCGWQQAKHPELKLLYHVPMSGFHGLYIEMKYGRNKTTEAQKEWLKELAAQGYFTAVCYGAEEAERVISRYLAFPGYPKIEGRAIPMTDYIGYAVPEDLCTIDREGGADDFMGCGHCLDYDGEADCDNCVISRIFEEYAKLTGQKDADGLPEYEKKEEVTVAGLIEILKGMDQKAIVISGSEKNIKVYPSRESKEGGRNIVLLC